MTEDRVDRLARRPARSDGGMVVNSEPGPRPVMESAFDGFARALVAPVTRRRAVALIGGAVMAGSLLRPSRALAACPAGYHECTGGGGQKLCALSIMQCCDNQYCAIACPYPWRRCEGPGVCQDTSALFSYQNVGPKYCEQTVMVTGSTTCGQEPEVPRRRGWCCAAGEDCGAEFGAAPRLAVAQVG